MYLHEFRSASRLTRMIYIFPFITSCLEIKGYLTEILKKFEKCIKILGHSTMILIYTTKSNNIQSVSKIKIKKSIFYLRLFKILSNRN